MIKHFKKENWFENKVRKDLPTKLTKHDKRFIIRKFLKYPHLSAVNVTAKFNEEFSSSVSPETI